jgi:signal transduction histidine kinase
MRVRPWLVLLLLVPMMLILSVYAYLRIEEQRAERLAEFARRVGVTSTAIRLVVEHVLRTGSRADLERLLADLVTKQTEIVRIRLLDADLRPVADRNLLPRDAGVNLGRHRQVIQSGQPDAVFRRVESFGLHSDLLPLRPRSATVEGVLEVVHVAAQLEHELLTINREIALRVGTLLLILVLVVWFALRRLVLQPLDDLMAGIRRVAEGAPHAAVPVRRRDEFGRVAESFNQMTERLEMARRALEAEAERSLSLATHLRRTETLATAGKLSSAIAHEVGTPLNIIAAQTEIVLQSLPPEHPRRPDLEIIAKQIDRITNIIRSALDPFRPREAEPEPTSVAGVLEVVSPLLRHAARARGVTLAVPRLDVPPVLADPGHLQQVLINLLMNAVEATPEGGRVELAARTASKDGRAGVLISIKDTGTGISPENLPRIFDPFFTTKPAGEGTGLGLAISRDLVNRQGGEIRVESQPNKGTLFSVWLPQAKSAT